MHAHVHVRMQASKSRQRANTSNIQAGAHYRFSVFFTNTRKSILQELTGVFLFYVTDMSS